MRFSGLFLNVGLLGYASAVSTSYSCITGTGDYSVVTNNAAAVSKKLGNTAAAGDVTSLTELFTANEKVTCEVTCKTTDNNAEVTLSVRTGAVDSSGKIDLTTPSTALKTPVKFTCAGANVNGAASPATYTYTGSAHNAFLYVEMTKTTGTASSTVAIGNCKCFFSSSGAVVKKKDAAAAADCFYGESSVEVLGKGVVQMQDLVPGDNVLSSEGKYEQFFGFTHKDSAATREFLSIETEGLASPLRVTAKHLLYKTGETYPVTADSLEIGDSVQALHGNHKIVKIEKMLLTGIYAPLTSSGDIIVDGLRASNYAALQEGSNFAKFQNGFSTGISQHSGVHIFTSPFRLLCKFGFSSLCSSVNEEGYLNWVKFGLDLAAFADKQHTVAQMFMLVIVMAFFLPVHGIDLITNYSFALILVGTFMAIKSFVRVHKVKTI